MSIDFDEVFKCGYILESRNSACFAKLNYGYDGSIYQTKCLVKVIYYAKCQELTDDQIKYWADVFNKLIGQPVTLEIKDWANLGRRAIWTLEAPPIKNKRCMKRLQMYLTWLRYVEEMPEAVKYLFKARAKLTNNNKLIAMIQAIHVCKKICKNGQYGHKFIPNSNHAIMATWDENAKSISLATFEDNLKKGRDQVYDYFRP